MPARTAAASAAEMRHRLLVEFNGRTVPYPRDRTVADLIADRVAEHPDRVAVVHAGGELTYRRLDGAANRLAAELAGAGVRKGTVVPIYLEGGPELPVTVLALLKLGAPFVPVDPGWPAERTAAALAALAPPAVVCGPAAVPAGGAATVVRASIDALPSLAGPPPRPAISAADVAYGFYTSGSTGEPKCALNPHLGLVNRFLYMTRTFAADGAVVLQNSRVSFDSSLWQLLWPLTAGNRVVLRGPAGALDLARVVATIAEHGVTMTDFVPSVFDALVELADGDPSVRAGLRSLRRLYLGGEQVNPRTVHRFRALLPDVRCTNTYGPTECSIGSVFHEISPADGDSVPIGRPIDNTYALVLDRRGRLVAPGLTGEIHLGGDCVGRGYLGDAAKTRRAFVPNPFPEVPGPLLYRTGDLGFVREDGLLHFVGRTDQQVKVGGVRLELLEVEAALADHPAVRAARVLVLGAGGERRLVGFVVPAPGAAVDADQLRAHAARRLPPEAVPARLVLLDALPLNANGKVDRRALAELAAAPAPGSGAPGSPDAGTAEEAAVAALWRELLGVAAVDLDTPFGSLGGTSLTAQRLALRLLARFDVRLAPRDLVHAATVRDQAALVRGGGTGGRAASAARLRRDVRLDPRIVGRPGSRPVPPRQVLLTGATGFVGAHLHRELVERTAARVVCLVRGADPDDARDRLVAAATGLGTWDPGMAARTEVVAGDLATSRFGLTPGRFAALGRRLDAIVHCGALVNLMLDYDALRAPNVGGTAEVVRLAATGPTTPVVALSTLGVVPAGDRPVDEDGPDDEDARLPDSGYEQSKWVAERLLALAHARGIPVTVYRLGEVGPHSGTGAGNPRGLLDNLLAACARLGLRPPLPAVTDWTPVDAVARVVTAGLLAGLPKEPLVQLLDPAPVPVERLLDALAEQTRLAPVSYLEFWTVLRDAVTAGDDEALTRLLAVLPAAPAAEADLAGLFTPGGRHYRTARSDRLLDELGLHWPRMDGPVLRRYARRLAAAVQVTG